MSPSLRHAALIAASVLLAPALAAEGPDQARWPSFRGPAASGLGAAPVPTAWNLETGDNVRWKTPIPGLAHSSPVVWGDRVYVTTAISELEAPELKIGLYGAPGAADDDGVQRWWVYALDRATGAVVWRVKAHEEEPAVRRHPKGSHANPTPTTDGQHVVAFFGSEGLYCFDRDGELLWKKDFGVLDAGSYMVPPFQWGFGNSPVIHEGKVIVLADVQKGGFLAVYDLADGREVWRVARDEVPTWTTPTVVDAGDQPQIVVNGFKHIGAYQLATGAEVWRMHGGGDVPVPRPVAAHGLVFITNAHGRMAPVYAVKAGARGDLTLAEGATSSEHVAWMVPRGGGYMQTPIVVGDELYVCRDNGTVSCFDARTGNRHYQERLAAGSDGFTASPVAAGGRIYFTSETGDVYVVKAGTAFEVVAENSLDEIVMASPAIAGDLLLYRTRSHLVALGETALGETAPAGR